MLIHVPKVAAWAASILLFFGHQIAPPETDVPSSEDSPAQVHAFKSSQDTAGVGVLQTIAERVAPIADFAGRVGDALKDQLSDFDIKKVVPSRTGTPPVCTWELVDPATEPHAIPIPFDQTTGHVEKKVCGAPEGDTSGLGSAVVDWRFVENGAPPGEPAAPAAPVVDVQALARQAYQELQVPTPKIGIGPDRSTVAVQLPTWLWVDDPGQLTADASTGGVTVTASATLTSTQWTLGEPARNPDFTGFRPGPAVTVTCQGPGTPPPASVDWKAEPPCGHVFRWRSTPERTGGAGTWPLTATTTWDVTWTATTGQTGQIQLTATGTDAVAVSEYRILLTAGR